MTDIYTRSAKNRRQNPDMWVLGKTEFLSNEKPRWHSVDHASVLFEAPDNYGHEMLPMLYHIGVTALHEVVCDRSPLTDKLYKRKFITSVEHGQMSQLMILKALAIGLDSLGTPCGNRLIKGLVGIANKKDSGQGIYYALPTAIEYEDALLEDILEDHESRSRSELPRSNKVQQPFLRCALQNGVAPDIKELAGQLREEWGMSNPIEYETTALTQS